MRERTTTAQTTVKAQTHESVFVAEYSSVTGHVSCFDAAQVLN